jgi:hypothetical protein
VIVTSGLASAKYFPSIVATGQSVGAALGALGGIEIIKAESSSETKCETYASPPKCRFGDYQGAAIDADPTDETSAWIGCIVDPLRPSNIYINILVVTRRKKHGDASGVHRSSNIIFL